MCSKVSPFSSSSGKKKVQILKKKIKNIPILSSFVSGFQKCHLFCQIDRNTFVIISYELSNAFCGFSLRRLGAELEGGGGRVLNNPSPSGGGKSRGPSGRGLNTRANIDAKHTVLCSASIWHPQTKFLLSINLTSSNKFSAKSFRIFFFWKLPFNDVMSRGFWSKIGQHSNASGMQDLT